MKVDRKELLWQLESCVPGLAKTDDLEQGNCFAFSPGQVTTYNEEIYCTHAVATDFSCAVPSRPLLETLRKLSEDEIDIQFTNDRLTIKCPGARRIGLNVHQEVVCNDHNVEQTDNWVDVPPAFTDGLAMAAESAAKESDMFAWTCVQFSPNGFQSSDNFQAIRYKLRLPLDRTFLIRRESCAAVNGLGVAAISPGREWLGMKTYTGLKLYVRIYDDEFPDLGPVFSAESVTSVRFPPGVLDAIQKAVPFLAETATGKQITIRLKPGKMMVDAQNVNGYYQEMKDISYDGPARSFSLNPKHIQALMKYDYPCHLGPNTVKIKGDNFALVASLEAPVS